MKAKQLLYSTITLLVLTISSCEVDDSAGRMFPGDPAINSGVETVDFGEVVAGQTATISTYVIGTGIDDGLTLTVEGEGYQVSRDKFRIVTDTSFVNIIFAPDIEAALGATNGTVTLSAGDITSTIQLSSVVLTPSIITASEEVVNIGDVVVGASDSKTISVEGQFIPGAVQISATSGFSVNPTSFDVGNGEHQLTVTYTADAAASEGAVSGEVTFSYGSGLSSTLPVTANIVLTPPSALPDGTVIYQNELDFPNSPADDTEFVLADLQGLSTTLYSGVSATYDLAIGVGGATGMEVQHAMCVDAINGSTAGKSDACNTSATLKQLGTKVTVSLTGLPKLVADYTVTFWARPAATSERELIVNFGGTLFTHIFNGASSNSYYKFEVEGSSDKDGNIVFDFGNNTDNTFRGIDFDHIEIVAGGI
ncbi:hypothetical protein N6H18_07950 [Reichenbachiella agarivorans]|uniref:IPT/TIG domain-containing protein n=1 Tax=Reichenbachiella agarivorans TaxID=2979464 RepID=A0ABY6CTM8_9BACT|nr:hypothetical protein [Reichenbachiella agarivorans]UXP33876.1 hypothetical protein N6H18_07950 [Reichenbachiella agarivorans]